MRQSCVRARATHRLHLRASARRSSADPALSPHAAWRRDDARTTDRACSAARPRLNAPPPRDLKAPQEKRTREHAHCAQRAGTDGRAAAAPRPCPRRLIPLPLASARGCSRRRAALAATLPP
eukprot:6192481-Pleurochrysis_carterae.AAC.2